MKTLLPFKLRWYLCYGVILTLLLLMVRFPKEELQQYVIGTIETAFPSQKCEINSLSFKFPSSLQFNNVILTNATHNKVTMKIDSVIVSPSLQKPLTNFTVTGNFYDGIFSSDIELNKKAQTVQLNRLQLTQVDANKFNQDIQISPQLMRGILNFSGTGTTSGSKSLQLTELQGRFTIQTGLFKAINPVLTLTEIPFDAIDFEISSKGTTLFIKKGMFKSSALSSSFSGTLQRKQALGKSELRLKGQLTPQQSFLEEIEQAKVTTKKLQKKFKKKSLPYVAIGPLQNLSFSFQN